MSAMSAVNVRETAAITGVSFVKARSRKLLREAVERARGLQALDAHRAHKDRDREERERFLKRYDHAPRPPEDDEVRGGSPLEGIPLPDYVPETWTVEWTATRLIRAWQHVSFGLGGAMEGGKAGIWPDYWHTWSDMMGWDEGEFRARPLEEWAKRRPQLSATEIRLNAEAEGWPLRYLAGHEREAHALQLWLESKVRRVKGGRAFQRFGWNRRMYERLRAAALARIAEGLARDGVPVS